VSRPVPWKKWSLLLLAGAAAATTAYFLPILDWIAAAQTRIETFGAWGPALYVALYILFTLALIPGSALTFTAGLLYGTAVGTAISLSASTAAACLAFLVSRYLLRDRLARRFSSSPRFRALDRAVERDAWKVVILMRLSPAFPYVLLNYAFGLTRVRLTTFAFFTLVGMIPATLFLVSTASALGDAADEARRGLDGGSAWKPPVDIATVTSMNEEAFRATVTWLRNRQLVLWSRGAGADARDQADIAAKVHLLKELVEAGKADPVKRSGESVEEARVRVERSLRDARHEAKEAARLLSEGRPGTARDSQKECAARLLEARGDARRVNWVLWTTIVASLLVTIAVGRMARRALTEPPPPPSDPPAAPQGE
jgi:uncharacterized membrane protein YdjX (TVP38/TMEM64 family)